MQRSRSSKFPYLALIFALVAPTSGSLVAQENTKIIWVAHFKADCVGVAPQKCYLIKDNMYDPWMYWYNEIERLDWQKGYAYEVVVAEERIENSPADASSINLRVVELLTMINAGAQPARSTTSRAT